MAQLTKLRLLNVNGCSELEELPSMESLTSLEELRVDGCVKLTDASNSATRSNFLVSGPISSVVPGSVLGTSSARQKTNTGPLSRNGESVKKTSGPLSGGVPTAARQNYGLLPPSLHVTGLITSSSISSGPLNSSGVPRKVSGPLDSFAFGKLNSVSVYHQSQP